MIRTYRIALTLLTALVVTLAAAGVVFAETSFNHNTGTVDRFYVDRDGRIFLTLANRPATAANCRGGWYVVSARHPQRDKTFEVLLMAWTSRVRVGLGVITPHTDGEFCSIDFAHLDR